MTTDTVRKVLAWSTVINYVILIIWFVAFYAAHDWIYAYHGRFFKLAPEQFDGLHYLGMSVYKIGILLFNLVPYLAMRIVEHRQKT
jgi:hypothetical protein